MLDHSIMYKSRDISNKLLHAASVRIMDMDNPAELCRLYTKIRQLTHHVKCEMITINEAITLIKGK